MAKSNKEMTVKVEGTDLVIRIPMRKPLTPSASGKSMIVASTGGNKVTDCKVNGKPVTVGLNAYVKDE